MYRGDITYYAPELQQPARTTQKRPKAAIPIINPQVCMILMLLVEILFSFYHCDSGAHVESCIKVEYRPPLNGLKYSVMPLSVGHHGLPSHMIICLRSGLFSCL